jgi:hypothetical protein
MLAHLSPVIFIDSFSLRRSQGKTVPNSATLRQLHASSYRDRQRCTNVSLTLRKIDSTRRRVYDSAIGDPGAVFHARIRKG